MTRQHHDGCEVARHLQEVTRHRAVDERFGHVDLAVVIIGLLVVGEQIGHRNDTRAFAAEEQNGIFVHLVFPDLKGDLCRP